MKPRATSFESSLLTHNTVGVSLSVAGSGGAVYLSCRAVFWSGNTADW